MRSKLFFLALWAFSAACFAQIQTEYISLRNDALDMLDFRVKAFREYEKLSAKTKNDIPLNGGELNMIHQAVIDRQYTSDRVVKYVLENSTSFKEDAKALRKALNDLNNTEWVFTFDGTPISDVDSKRKLVRTLGLGLTLADNYLQAIYFFQDDPTLRRIVNENDSIPSKMGDQLKARIKQLLNKENLRTLAAGLYVYHNQQKELEQLGQTDEEFKFWTKLINESFILDQLKDKKIDLVNDPDLSRGEIYRGLAKLFKKKKQRSDFVHKAGYKVMHVLSKAFGNTAGRFQSRDGYLKNREDVVAHVASLIKPLDILLEKTPMRLTDRFIPGYYGHNAIWLGTEEELKELELWDHPVIKPLQAQIREGKSIVEALRPGVVMNSIHHFLDIDDMAVMRNKNIDREELKKNLIVAASQYGKAYDFNFDVATQDVLVCSELIFMSYLNINWRTEKIAGRWTINPDAVAERARPDQEFDTIVLYTGGERVDGKLNEKMAYTLANADKDDKELLVGFKKIDDEDKAPKEGIFRNMRQKVQLKLEQVRYAR